MKKRKKRKHKRKIKNTIIYMSILLCISLFIIYIYNNNNSQDKIAAANTVMRISSESEILASRVSDLNSKIANINSYDSTSFDAELDNITDFLYNNDIEKATVAIDELAAVVTSKLGTIKNTISTELNSLVTTMDTLSDDYSKNLITTINSELSTDDITNATSTLNLLKYKVDNLLYAAGKKDTLTPLTIDGVMIVNKDFGLPIDYGTDLTEELKTAFKSMENDASKNGIDLYIVSGFRSYSDQVQLYSDYLDNYGQEATRFSSPAGYSEHQTGLAIDIGGVDNSAWVNAEFSNTAEYKWLHDNAYKYGFILRYPPNKEDITGYMFESWHYRYVGVELSTYLTKNNLTIEEYFKLK